MSLEKPHPATLNRSTVKTATAPVRIVHLGLGAFHRSHQAWYTQHASDSADWGIAAFTGRRPDAAVALAAQDGLYTLIERGRAGDRFELVSSIVEAHDGADLAMLDRLVSAATTAIITLTITEAAYHLGPDGALDSTNAAVCADIAGLRAAYDNEAGTFHAGSSPAAVSTASGRLVQALAARRQADAGPIAVVSCDNLANNAGAARSSIMGVAEAVDPALASWIAAHVSFVGTSIDRITPRTTDAELALVAAECGYADAAPVVTEPFSDWVLSGAFPAGRPDWESAGAVIVEDIERFENRKLWLLNGAHSLMAYAGLLLGHQTVAQALADPQCAAWVEQFWDEAEASLPAGDLNIPAYRQALLERFGNARIAHHLTQIAMDGSSKLRLRAVPVYKAERAAGRTGLGALRMIAAWVGYVQATHHAGATVSDAAGAAGISAALSLDDSGATSEAALAALISVVDADLGADPCVIDTVRSLDCYRLRV